MTLLLTGVTGTLGSDLKKLFPEAISPPHNEFDICDKPKVDEFFKNNQIDLVIHTAALTTVRGCEEDKTLAAEINIEGTKNIVDGLFHSNPDGYFVYISTACVFDGHSGMYNETDSPSPENFYSSTKLLGEYEVKKLKKSLIIRTNFTSRRKWPYLKAFTDRFGTYLFSDQVAKGIKEVIEHNLEGIVHIVGQKKISMFELAKHTTPDIQPMTMDEYSGPNLTIDMSLDTKLWKKYNILQNEL